MVMYCSLKEAWGESGGASNGGSNNNMNNFSNGMLPTSVGETPQIPNGGPTINNLYHGKCANKDVQKNMQTNQQELLSTPYAHLSRYRKNIKPKSVPQQFILAQPNSHYNQYETVGSHLACDSYLQHIQGCEECLNSVMTMYHPEDLDYFRMYNNHEPSPNGTNASESYSEMNGDNEKPIHVNKHHTVHKIPANTNASVVEPSNLVSSNAQKARFMTENDARNNIVTNANVRQVTGGIEINDITNLIIAVLVGILLIYGLDTVMKVISKMRN